MLLFSLFVSDFVFSSATSWVRHPVVLGPSLPVDYLGVPGDEVPVAQDGGVAALVSAPVVARLGHHGSRVEGLWRAVRTWGFPGSVVHPRKKRRKQAGRWASVRRLHKKVHSYLAQLGATRKNVRGCGETAKSFTVLTMCTNMRFFPREAFSATRSRNCYLPEDLATPEPPWAPRALELAEVAYLVGDAAPRHCRCWHTFRRE